MCTLSHIMSNTRSRARERHIHTQQTYGTSEYATFPEALDAFLKEVPPHFQPNFASLAVAGPVSNQVCSMTNCDWVIDGPALTKQFHIPYVGLSSVVRIPLLECW